MTRGSRTLLLVACVLAALAPACSTSSGGGASRGKGITLGVDLPFPAEPEIQETMERLIQQGFWTAGPCVTESPVLRADTFQMLAEKAGPAVVNVFTSQIAVGKVLPGPLGIFPVRIGVPVPHTGTSLGSGFLINPQGYVLTSREVILAAQSVEVRLPGHDETFPAKVIGEAPATDVVLLKIDAPTCLPYLPVGNSDSVLPGQAVVALGNPNDTPRPTVTTGVLTQRCRGRLSQTHGLGTTEETEFLEVDAAIGPTNVGGPLVDLDGNAIGINMIVPAPDDGTQAARTGYAVPIEVAKRSVAIFLTHNPLIQMFGK